MNAEMLKLIVKDCREYTENNGLVSHIEHWSKEQLAFAISDLAIGTKYEEASDERG